MSGPVEALRTKEACAYLGCSKSQLYNWWHEKQFRRIKRGRYVRWPLSALERFLRLNSERAR